MSEEIEFIKNRIEALNESIHFFSNEMKSERERWVINRLLDYLKLDRGQDEVKSSTEEPIDVVFRDGFFQIKEILNGGRKRGAEYAQALEKAKNARKIADLLEPYSPIDLQIEDALAIVADHVNKWSCKYPLSTRRNIDLLFYMNLEDIFIQYQGHRVPIDRFHGFEQAGWRS